MPGFAQVVVDRGEPKHRSSPPLPASRHPSLWVSYEALATTLGYVLTWVPATARSQIADIIKDKALAYICERRLALSVV